MANSSKLWTRNFAIVTFANFADGINFYLLMSMSAGYATDSFGSDPSTAGLVVSVFIAGALVSRAFVGKQLAFLGYKRVLLLGLGIVLFSTILYQFAPAITALIIVRIIHGYGFGTAVSACATIVGATIPKDRSGEGMGYYSLSAVFATAVGPYIAATLSESGDYSFAFIICTGIVAIGFLVTLLLELPSAVATEEQKAAFKGFKVSDIIEKSVLQVSFVALIAYFCFVTIISFLGLFARSLGLSGNVNLFFLVYASSVLLARPFVGKSFDRYGLAALLYPALGLTALGLVMLAVMNSDVLLLCSAVVLGLGHGTIQSASLSEITKVCPAYRLGIGTTTYYLLVDVGSFLGPLIAGVVLPLIGFRGAFFLLSGTILATLVWFWSQRKPRVASSNLH